MIELRVFAALLAIERARERARERASLIGGRPAVALLGGVALGWIAGSAGRRAS